MLYSFIINALSVNTLFVSRVYNIHVTFIITKISYFNLLLKNTIFLEFTYFLTLNHVKINASRVNILVLHYS